METDVINYKGYTIYTEEGTEKGIFFRWPIQKVDFDAYYGHAKFSVGKFARNIKNPIRRLYEIMIGNGNAVKNIDNWLCDLDFGGFLGNIMCSPIYFKREYRKLSATPNSENANFKSIESYGYEGPFNECGGVCALEKTIFKIANGKTIKSKRKTSYYYTYAHVIKNVINNNQINT